MNETTYIIGNWKMHGDAAIASELAAASAATATDENVQVVLCPPACWLRDVQQALNGSAVALGGQDCHYEEAGAHTGDVSANMLKALGCGYVLVGHSERRQNHHESDSLVRSKAEAALKAGLTPVICVGETLQEKESKQTSIVLDKQLHKSVPEGRVQDVIIAYEPVWAIGSGKTPTTEEIGQVHAHIKAYFAADKSGDKQPTVVYGGSVKSANAAEILAQNEVDGVLVGGASLKADDFETIIKAGTN